MDKLDCSCKQEKTVQLYCHNLSDAWSLNKVNHLCFMVKSNTKYLPSLRLPSNPNMYNVSKQEGSLLEMQILQVIDTFSLVYLTVQGEAYLKFILPQLIYAWKVLEEYFREEAPAKAGRCLRVSSALARLLALSRDHSFPKTVAGFNSPFLFLQRLAEQSGNIF